MVDTAISDGRPRATMAASSRIFGPPIARRPLPANPAPVLPVLCLSSSRINKATRTAGPHNFTFKLQKSFAVQGFAPKDTTWHVGRVKRTKRGQRAAGGRRDLWRIRAGPCGSLAGRWRPHRNPLGRRDPAATVAGQAAGGQRGAGLAGGRQAGSSRGRACRVFLIF